MPRSEAAVAVGVCETERETQVFILEALSTGNVSAVGLDQE